MSDYSTLIIMIIAMVVMVEMMIKMIPNKKQKNGGSLFARTTFNKGSIKTGIIMFAICAVFCGFMFFKLLLWDNGISAFREKILDINSILNNGEVPELGKNVSVKFRVVGDAFRLEGADGVFCPIVLYDEVNDADGTVVCCLHLSSKKNSALDDFRSNSSVQTDDHPGPHPINRYTGIIMDFSLYSDWYMQAVNSSGMAGEDYVVKDYIIDTYIGVQKTKQEIIWMGVMMVGCSISGIIVFVVYKKRMQVAEK